MNIGENIKWENKHRRIVGCPVCYYALQAIHKAVTIETKDKVGTVCLACGMIWKVKDV